MTQSDDAPRLITSILSDRPVLEFVRDTAVGREIERRLVDVRTASGALVTWWGVNETRVDLGVRAHEDEWRIVYGSSDDQWIDWLSVYRRPPQFSGVPGGRAVIVNGASGAGKSSLLDALQRESHLPWVVFDEPVLGSVNESYLIWRDQAEVLHRGFLEGIAALVRSGNVVAVAAAGHPQRLFEEVFADLPVLFVGLDCDLETLLAREHGREGRWGGLAAASFGVHEDWWYRLRFDTAHRSADEIASEVLRSVDEM